MNLTCERPAETTVKPVAAESHLWRDVVETYGTRMVLVAIGLATSVIVARTLGPSGRGLFAVAVAIGGIGVQFGNLGLHASNTYYVAKDRSMLPALIGNTLVISFGLGGLGSLAAWLAFTWFPGVAPLQHMLLALALAWIPFGLAYMLLQNLLLGIQQVRTYNAIELVNKVLGLLLCGVAIYFKLVNANVLFGATMLALVVSFAWTLARVCRVSRGFFAPSLAIFQSNIGLGMKAYLIAFFGYLVLRIDLVMVKYLAGTQMAGYYSISETMAENILTLPVVIGILLFPKLSAMTDNRSKLLLTGKAAALTASLLLPVMVIGSVFAAPVVRVVFGREFLPAVQPFVWLMPGSFLLGIETVIVQYLNSLGFPLIIVYSWLLVTLSNIGVNFWAIPRYGITGAAIVSTVSYAAIFLIVVAVLSRSAKRALVLQPA